MTAVLSIASAAATLTPAEVRHMDISSVDYPADALLRGQQARVGVEVTVTPDGKPETCRLTRLSGVESLDLKTCQVVLRQARYDPARDGEGRPVHGQLSTSFAWTLGGVFGKLAELPVLPDYTMTIQPRPGASAEPMTVAVDTLVGEDGTLLACSVPNAAEVPELARAACRVLPSVWVVATINGVDGRPVRCIKTVTIRFATEG